MDVAVADDKYWEGKIHRDDEDYQRYITERIYIDRRSGCIVEDRTSLLKNGQKHKALNPEPIHVQSLVEMTQQYEQESSPQSFHALLSILLHQETNDDVSTGLPRSSNDFDNVNACLQAALSDQVYIDTEDYSRLLVSRLRGDELVDYWLTMSLTLTGVFTPTTRKQAIQSPQKDFWLEAEQKDIESITKKKVLQPVQLPRGRSC